MDAKSAQIKEQKILKEELANMRKGTKVYKQQQNSTIFFRESKEKVFSDCKKTQDGLIQEYDAASGMTKKDQD